MSISFQSMHPIHRFGPCLSATRCTPGPSLQNGTQRKKNILLVPAPPSSPRVPSLSHHPRRPMKPH
jgi:hypothetical protein